MFLASRLKDILMDISLAVMLMLLPFRIVSFFKIWLKLSCKSSIESLVMSWHMFLSLQVPSLTIF
jgi:hypothetical protein